MFNEPIIGEHFFDRSEILTLVNKRAFDLKHGYRQNLALIGPSLIGKSSIIHYFLAHMDQEAVVCLYLEIKEERFSAFIDKFIGIALYNLFKKISPREAVDDLDLLIKAAQKRLPKISDLINRIRLAETNKKNDEVYKLLLDLTASIHAETKLSVIMIFDDFERLSNFRLKNCFVELGKKIMEQRQTMYVLLSSKVNLAKKVLANELRLLFGNFEIIEVKPFDDQICLNFFKQSFAGIKFVDWYMKFIIAFSDGYPFYLDVLSSKLKELVQQSRTYEIFPYHITQTLEGALFNNNGILYQHFNSLIESLPRQNKSIGYDLLLISLAQRPCRLSSIAATLKTNSREVSRLIAYLMEKDIISKEGVLLRFNDKLFEFWIREVYQKQTRSFKTDVFTKSRDFVCRMEKVMVNFEKQLRQPILERIEALFRVFQNEIVCINQKQFRLFSLPYIKPQYLGNGFNYLTAKNQNKLWVCGIKENGIMEEDVLKFKQDCAKFKDKAQRKIIIGLDGIEMNAKLLAKQEKIWTWNLRDLNLLLDLYGQPKIIK